MSDDVVRADDDYMPKIHTLIPSVSDVLGKDDDDWLPSLTIELELAPWYWRVGWYSAPVNSHFLILYLGPLRIHLWANQRSDYRDIDDPRR